MTVRLALVTTAVAAAGSIALARPSPQSSRVNRFLMGTSMSIEAIGGSADARATAIDEAFAAMVEVDRLMSNYRADSELAAINRRAADGPVTLSEPMMSVLAAADQVSRRSRGAFDITIGPLMKLWGFYQKQPHVPTARELDAVRPLIGYQYVELNPAARTVRFTRRGVELDLGGIAKGFAAELAGGVLRRRGLSGAIDAGGNQYFVGTPAGRTRWNVGIEDPGTRGALLGVLSVEAGAVATSGGYHNFFEVAGTRYGHILDPRTLRLSDRSLSVTIVSRDATLADALTKPVFLLGPVEGLALAESFPGTMAIIATRAPGGGVALAMSKGLSGAFSPGTTGTTGPSGTRGLNLGAAGVVRGRPARTRRPESPRPSSPTPWPRVADRTSPGERR